MGSLFKVIVVFFFIISVQQVSAQRLGVQKGSFENCLLELENKKNIIKDKEKDFTKKIILAKEKECAFHLAATKSYISNIAKNHLDNNYLISALEISQLGLVKFKNDENLLLVKGVSLFKLDKREQALKTLNEVVAKNKYNSLANRYIGAYYYDKNQFKEAYPYLKIHAVLEPKNFEANAALGDLCIELQDNKCAGKFLNIASQLKPEDPILALKVGKLLKTNKEFDSALFAFRRSVSAKESLEGFREMNELQKLFGVQKNIINTILKTRKEDELTNWKTKRGVFDNEKLNMNTQLCNIGQKSDCLNSIIQSGKKEKEKLNQSISNIIIGAFNANEKIDLTNIKNVDISNNETLGLINLYNACSDKYCIIKTLKKSNIKKLNYKFYKGKYIINLYDNYYNLLNNKALNNKALNNSLNIASVLKNKEINQYEISLKLLQSFKNKSPVNLSEQKNVSSQNLKWVDNFNYIINKKDIGNNNSVQIKYLTDGLNFYNKQDFNAALKNFNKVKDFKIDILKNKTKINNEFLRFNRIKNIEKMNKTIDKDLIKQEPIIVYKLFNDPNLEIPSGITKINLLKIYKHRGIYFEKNNNELSFEYYKKGLQLDGNNSFFKQKVKLLEPF